ncbi:MAG: hypothetical protein Q4D89_15040 [Arachnia propionica]|uniref:hypothetical protein n=1 Tax=Arachnia propionica TaxID=1750 RepID=UPI002705FA83|nr:hypothetical protein [Arachnia propionica]
MIVGYGVAQTHDLVREALTPVRITTSPAPDTLPPMSPVHVPSHLTEEPAWVFRSPELTAPVEVHLGARGPIVADEDTVIGLDGATGRQLWSFERNEGHLARLRLRAGAPERVMVSPDGRSVIVVTCLNPPEKRSEWPPGKGFPMLTVIDAVTGNPRFNAGTEGLGAIPYLSCSDRDIPYISMTDHVMVIESHGYDLITGTERWQLPEKLFLLEGPQGSSHVVALRSDDGVPDGGSETLQERGWACPMCIDNTVDILSDEDLSATHQLDAIGYLAFGGLLMRGWLLTHEDSTHTNAWLNVDTLQRIPITGEVQPYGDEHFWRAPDTAMLRSQVDQKVPDGSTRPTYHVLDSWTGETGIVTTPYEDSTFGPLGVGLWFDVARHGRRFQVWGSDGSPVGERIELAMPAGEPWEIQGFLRSHHGLVVAFSWEPRQDLASNVSVAMYR